VGLSREKRAGACRPFLVSAETGLSPSPFRTRGRIEIARVRRFLVSGCEFFALILAIVGLILINRSFSTSIWAVLRSPQRCSGSC